MYGSRYGKVLGVKGLALLLTLLLISPMGVSAQGLQGALDETRGDFNERFNDTQNAREQRQRERQQAAQSRDRSRDVCYSLPNGSDAQTACLGDHPYAVKNERARNLLLGQCYAFSASNELSQDLSYICANGVNSCSLLEGDAAYWCHECDGTRRWLAVYSLGHIIQCFK